MCRISRRGVLKTTAAATFGYWIGGATRSARSQSPNEALNVALIGVGGQGRSNLNGVAGENIVALCDVDDERAGNAYERFPKARRYYDYRRMLDEYEKQIDAVVVSTPDHTHFHPSYAALQLGKHLYCEKPLAHSVWEVRTLTDLAARQGVATQLGVQRHTLQNVHRVVELVQAGAIGSVSEVHSWVGGERGMPAMPTEFPEIPSHLKWDLWLGPAADRQYSPAYCPYHWRFWWDFGTGETGNWGCHILDIPFWALDLKYPTHVAADGPPVDAHRTPKSMSMHYHFPADGDRDAVQLHWHHAKEGPPILRERGLPHAGNNTLFVGSSGMLLCGFGKLRLYRNNKPADYEAPQKTIPDSPGFHREWLDACRGGPRATCDFAYSGPLTETVLLGNVAYRAQSSFRWDAESLEADGNDKVSALIKPEYPEGWRVG